MKDVAWIKWIASFDMEPLLSSVLKIGTGVSMALFAASLALHQWAGKAESGFGPNLQAKSVPLLILADLGQFDSPGFWSRLLLHLGVSVLLLIPYVRLLVSMIYFAWIERSWKHVVFTGFVLIIMTIGLFTNWV